MVSGTLQDQESMYLARSFRLAWNRYIVCESAYMKVCPYQVMIRNGLFEETNEQCIFSKLFCD